MPSTQLDTTNPNNVMRYGYHTHWESMNRVLTHSQVFFVVFCVVLVPVSVLISPYMCLDYFNLGLGS